MVKKVICFGEMLWDCFPDMEVAGGAPMNVALHLQQLGLDVKMISRVGRDEHGKKLLDFIKKFELPEDLIQEDILHPTGKVIVDNTDNENIKYEIVAPSAWDFITLTAEIEQEVSKADAMVFGSLGVRSEVSWHTLYHLVQKPLLTIFDINLRTPFIDFKKIEILMGHTDILKINEDELVILADHFNIDVNQKNGTDSARSCCEFLVKTFPIKTICITLGSNGAIIYHNKEITQHGGYKVKVEDTVGSGDAFLSGFVKMYLEGNNPKEILDFACELGAFVATKKGGTPKYKITDIKVI